MEDDKTLNDKNYKEFARNVIKRYHDLYMTVDAIVWSSILGYYESEIKRLQEIEHKYNSLKK